MDSVNHSVSDLYGLKRNIVPSKSFEDVEGDSLCLRARDITVDGDTFTSQDLLPLPVSTDGSHTCGGDTLACPLKSSVLLRDLQSGDGDCCTSILGPVFLSTPEGFEGIDRETQQTQPCYVVSTVEQADSLQVGGDYLVAQEKYGMSETPFKETLEIADILLDLGQHGHQQNPVQPAVFRPETLFIQEGSLADNKGISLTARDAHPPATYGHVEDHKSKGRRKKQAKPHHVEPTKQSAQEDFKALIIPQATLFFPPAPDGKLASGISQILGVPQASHHHGSIWRKVGNKQEDDRKFSPLDIDIPFEWSTTPRDREEMFFPHLHDSSYKAEAAERKRREAALHASLSQMTEPLEDRYIENAAVLPDLRPLPPALSSVPSQHPISNSGLPSQDEPLKIHGCSVEKYKRIYHTVVDPRMTTRSGHPQPYSLRRGRVIKQQLWKRLSCPSFLETVDADGRVWISESYCSPSAESQAPHIELDLSGEPMPENTKSKIARL